MEETSVATRLSHVHGCCGNRRAARVPCLRRGPDVVESRICFSRRLNPDVALNSIGVQRSLTESQLQCPIAATYPFSAASTISLRCIIAGVGEKKSSCPFRYSLHILASSGLSLSVIVHTVHPSSCEVSACCIASWRDFDECVFDFREEAGVWLFVPNDQYFVAGREWRRSQLLLPQPNL